MRINLHGFKSRRLPTWDAYLIGLPTLGGLVYEKDSSVSRSSDAYCAMLQCRLGVAMVWIVFR